MNEFEPMKRASQDQSHARARLDRAIELATELRTVLLEEQAALAERDFDALEAVVARKVDAIAALETADGDLRRLTDRTDVDTDTGIALLRERFVALARECSVLNAGNGQAIHARRTQTDQRLTVLRGGSVTTTTYGRHGAKPEIPGQQTLAQA